MFPPKTALAAPYYRVLHRLWRRGPAEARVLLTELGLSRAVGDRVLAQMETEGIAGPAPATGQWELRRSYGTVLGLHLGTSMIQAVLVDFTGQVVMTRELPHPELGTGLAETILGAVTRMEPLIRPPAAPPLRGVAVSLPGIVDPYRLILLESKPLNLFEPQPLKEALGRPLGRPVTVENDANCCCWGEAALRRDQDLGDFLCIWAEQRPYTAAETGALRRNTAVGLGLYLRGSVYHGRRFSAGEFQSILKPRGGHRNQFSIDDEAMNRSYDDPAVEEVLARELSRHAAFLVNTLNLDRVYLNWPREDRKNRVAALLRDEIRANWSYDDEVRCTVELPAMGRLAPAYGAAGLHLESLYQTADGPAPFFPGKH